ncbi:ABC transporter permease [Streptomyces bambusae]|uniref:ABC transporter permease n=1 Tax=Streptomyces bambusae TaxID=1550616 RepID=UPI001CFFBCC8|nr:ABC transporter permease [Streptomyces bambusae]MCB5169663.1 ABC transporter permease [Streptomyces bambusae]
MSIAYGRLAALGRAELTLLARNKNNLFIALLMPVAMISVLRSSLSGIGPGDLPMGAGAATMIGGTGMVLILVVYMALVSAFTARREELVLKRLRTGEATDLEILAGGSLPAVVLALLQVLLLTAGGAIVLGLGAPEQPLLLVAGLVVAVVLLVPAAALTTAITRNVESAGITTLPFFLLSAIGSGMMLPTDVLPDRVADVCELLPLSGAMQLIRAGWTGGTGAGELLGAALTALAWIVITVFAVRRWFRWEPRR